MMLRTSLSAYILLQGCLLTMGQSGPSQQCVDDAGPPWADDSETFGGKPYSYGSQAQPVLINGECAGPVKKACETKDPKTAYLEGPIDCGGKGWFCRISEQPGWSDIGVLKGDVNFMHCNTTTPVDEEHDRDGHCHGGSDDDVFGWWARDHWFRNYAGHLTCCCGLDEIPGLVNRCDYRKRINTPTELSTCRDANEEHNVELGGSCNGGNPNFSDPALAPGSSDKCWEVSSFGFGNDDDDGDGGGGSATPAPPSPVSTPTPPPTPGPVSSPTPPPSPVSTPTPPPVSTPTPPPSPVSTPTPPPVSTPTPPPSSNCADDDEGFKQFVRENTEFDVPDEGCAFLNLPENAEDKDGFCEDAGEFCPATCNTGCNTSPTPPPVPTPTPAPSADGTCVNIGPCKNKSSRRRFRKGFTCETLTPKQCKERFNRRRCDVFEHCCVCGGGRSLGGSP